MKKIFALFSLIAMLMVAFTSQAVAIDHTVKLGMETQKVFDLSVQNINVSTDVAECRFEVKYRYRCNELFYTIFNTEIIATKKDLPLKVGWTKGTINIINNSTLATNTYKDLPFEVGWTK